MDFPWLKSLVIVCGKIEDKDKVADAVSRISNAAPWWRAKSLKEAGTMIINRDNDTPRTIDTISERQTYWSDDIIMVVMDEVLGYDVDAITLLGLSHVADKGVETGVCGVVGMVWSDEDPWSRQVRSDGSQDLLSLVLSEAMILDCGQVNVLVDELHSLTN